MPILITKKHTKFKQGQKVKFKHLHSGNTVTGIIKEILNKDAVIKHCGTEFKIKLSKVIVFK